MDRLIALLVVAALTSACASQPKQVELKKIPDDTRILLDVLQADSRLPDASSDGGTYAKNVGAGALGGAGMGAVAGFTMGFACGPLVIICGPIGAIGGAMGGTVFGIGLQKHKKDQVTISMATSLVLQTGTGVDANVEKREFKTTSSSHHVDYWIGKDGDNFREELRFQLSRHAQEMVAELSPRT